jgi:signal transduction histidine kinase
MGGMKLPAWGIVAAAGVFGAALLGTSAIASRSLRERDAAVREGILARAAHELEAQLRASTPSEAGPVLEAFLAGKRDVVAGVSVIGPAGVVARAGAEPDGSFEVTAGLGRDWRPGAMGLGPEEGRGGGPGGGYMTGRGSGGAGGRAGSPLRLRLQPAPALGRDSSLARFVLAGGFAAAFALVALAVVAARGLAERERREAAEADARRLATVARAGAGLAHRLRNPLAVVKGTAQLLEERVPGTERERAARIVAASVRMETILGRLLDFARPPAPQPTTFDLAALAREVAARGEGIAVRADAPVAVHADREHVETVLEELLANARAFDPDGTVEVAVARRDGRARLDVSDRGPGPELDPDGAFEPYATSRPDGTGLGLAIVRALAVANGGSASLAARPGGGCVASLVLPGTGA